MTYESQMKNMLYQNFSVEPKRINSSYREHYFYINSFRKFYNQTDSGFTYFNNNTSFDITFFPENVEPLYENIENIIANQDDIVFNKIIENYGKTAYIRIYDAGDEYYNIFIGANNTFITFTSHYDFLYQNIDEITELAHSVK